MFDFFAEVQEGSDDELRAIKEAVAELDAHEVLVGIPEEDSARESGDGVGNAALLFIHTNGSPRKGIPPRPVLEPAIEHDSEIIADLLEQASDVALSGNKAGVTPALEKAGMQGQNSARGWFTNSANGWAPNHPATIKRKGSDRPLIDSDEMRKAITYKVRKV